jgi:hypothetical protein
MISLRAIAIWIGMCVISSWATANVGTWTWAITFPLTALAGCAAASLDARERRRPWSRNDDS